jgi:hypothetical protein
MMNLDEILNLPTGTKFKILGISETNEEVDDVLILLEKPIAVGGEVIVYVESPSGITRHIDTPIDLIGDFYLP